MTAGTGDGDGRTCGNCNRDKCRFKEETTAALRSMGVTLCENGWTPKSQLLGMPYRGECDKPQPQGAPTTDFSACLLKIEKSLSGLADVAQSRSVTQGDAYCKLTDSLIDAMESVQVLRNQANCIELDEDEAI